MEISKFVIVKQNPPEKSMTLVTMFSMLWFLISTTNKTSSWLISQDISTCYIAVKSTIKNLIIVDKAIWNHTVALNYHRKCLGKLCPNLASIPNVLTTRYFSVNSVCLMTCSISIQDIMMRQQLFPVHTLPIKYEVITWSFEQFTNFEEECVDLIL